MKIPKQINVKTALIFVVIGILITSGLFYVFAATPSSTFYISSGVYPGAPSYTIWKEGSNYFAKDANGLIAYSGTNASQITINCVNQLTSGGLIFFKSGLYDFDSEVSVPYSIVFRGEGIETQIRVTATSHINLFKVTAYYVSFEHLYFNGNVKKGSAISFEGGAYFGKVESCNFYNLNTSISVYGNTGSNILGRILHNTFWSGEYFIKINSDAGYWTTDWLIMGNRFNGATIQAIQIGSAGSSTGARIISNTIENSPTGIRLNQNSTYAKIFFNRFENCTSNGIYILGSPSYIHIKDNYFATATIYSSGVLGPGCEIFDNDGTTTEQTKGSGTAEASDTDEIPFGWTFDAAPQTVLITVNENDARYIAMAYDISTTNFTLYLWDDTAGVLETVDKTISWYAEYQP